MGSRLKIRTEWDVVSSKFVIDEANSKDVPAIEGASERDFTDHVRETLPGRDVVVHFDHPEPHDVKLG